MTQLLARDFGPCLTLDSTTLIKTYVAGTAIALSGIAELELLVKATGRAGSTITSMEVELQSSDDLITWTPVATVNEASSTPATEQSTNIVANSTVPSRLAGNFVGISKYLRVAGKYTGGQAAAGDELAVSLRFAEEV